MLDIAIAFFAILVYCHMHKPDVNSSGGQSAKGYHHMSPEARKPETPTQTGSDKFVDIGHPTGDRVRPFKQGELSDVHDKMQERGVPAPGDIHPLTLEVDVNKIPLDPETQSKWYTKTAAKVAGVVLALTGVASGIVAATGGDDEPTGPRKQPSVSAPANPSDNPTSNQSPSQEITASPGESSTTPETGSTGIAGIETRPSAEQQAEAETKVSEDDYPTIEEALPAIVDRLNAYTNGAVMDLDSRPLVETPESIAAGERVLDATYIPDRENMSYIDLTNIKKLRHSVGTEFTYLNDWDGAGGKEGTFRMDSKPDQIEKVTDLAFKEAYEVLVTTSTVSNFEELDPDQTVVNFTGPTTEKMDIVLAKDGNWYLRQIKSISH